MDCSQPGSSLQGFPRQEYWRGLPSPSPGDLPDPGIEPTSSALVGSFFTPSHLGSLTAFFRVSPAASCLLKTLVAVAEPTLSQDDLILMTSSKILVPSEVMF